MHGYWRSTSVGLAAFRWPWHNVGTGVLWDLGLHHQEYHTIHLRLQATRLTVPQKRPQVVSGSSWYNVHRMTSIVHLTSPVVVVHGTRRDAPGTQTGAVLSWSCPDVGVDGGGGALVQMRRGCYSNCSQLHSQCTSNLSPQRLDATAPGSL